MSEGSQLSNWTGLLTLFSQGTQLDPHLLQGLLQLAAARALLLQGELHVAVLQRHGRLGLRRQRPIGGGAHVLPTASEYALEWNGERRGGVQVEMHHQ